MSTFWDAAALLVVVVACAAGVVAAVRVVLRAVRLRRASAAELERAGAPAGTEDPAAAFDRAEGRRAWMRIGGGF